MVKTINRENINSTIAQLEWQPLSTDIIITMNETVEDESELNLSSSTILQTQFVLAVGSMVREIQVGDEVMLDMDKLSTRTRDPRDADSVIVQLNVFPLPLEDDTVVGCIPANAVKFIKKK